MREGQKTGGQRIRITRSLEPRRLKHGTREGWEKHKKMLRAGGTALVCPVAE